MATAAQIDANRLNAQHSTGPRTEEGKARSARNNTRHGLTSREFVILPGQEEEFEEFIAELHESVKPHGALENELFRHLARAAWNLRRCQRAEVTVQSSAQNPDGDTLIDPAQDARLHSIELYARRAERSFHKALKEIKALQTERHFMTNVKFIRTGNMDGMIPAPLALNTRLQEPLAGYTEITRRANEARLARWVNGAPDARYDELLRRSRRPAPSAHGDSEHSNPIAATSGQSKSDAAEV